MLSIEKHLLEGNKVTQSNAPTRGGRLAPKYLVYHYTAGSSAQNPADWHCNPAAKASPHPPGVGA